MSGLNRQAVEEDRARRQPPWVLVVSGPMSRNAGIESISRTLHGCCQEHLAGGMGVDRASSEVDKEDKIRYSSTKRKL